MAWTSTSSPTTVWVGVSPGSVISETLLSQIQAEVAAAQAAAAAAAASAADAEDSQDDAEAALTAANAAVVTSQENATNAESFANQATLIAASLTPIPTGGAEDQVLAKASGADYDYYWKTDATGGGGGGGGDALTTDPLSQFAATTSAQLAGVITDETGTGALVFATSPTLASPTTTGLLTTAASTTSSAGLTLPHGVAPTSPNNGNLWTTTAGVYARIDGTSLRLLDTAEITRDDSASPNNAFTIAPDNTHSWGTVNNAWSIVASREFRWESFGSPMRFDSNVTFGTSATHFEWRRAGALLASMDGNGVLTAVGTGLTALNASNLSTGTVPTARLGSGTASSSTFLRGDNTWQTISGGGDALTSGTLAQFAATTSAELRGVLSDETGTGSAVFANTPTLVTPVLGVATATSINKVAITAPATSATLTIADGATLTASATATVSGTNTGDQTSVTGNAGTATALQTARTINGTSFDGTANITVAAAAGTLTGATLAAGVTASSLTSVGTLSALTMGGTLAAVDNLVTRPYFQDYAEVVNAIGNSTGTLTVDYSSGNVATATLTGNITTFSITNPPATGRAGALTLILTQDGTGSRTVTWGSSVKWSAGTAPTLSGANKVDIINLVTVNAGTTWRATASVNHD